MMGRFERLIAPLVISFRVGSIGFWLGLAAVSGCNPRGGEISAPEAPGASGQWVDVLAEEVRTIDEGTDGAIGLYVRKLRERSDCSYDADRMWYLASTTKILVAVVVLRAVEKGELALDQKLAFRNKDAVDGMGDVRFLPHGSGLKVRELIEKMLVNSDSTATDMLIRAIGEKELNRQIIQITGNEGIGRVSTLLQVRYDAYSMLHPNAAHLSNMALIRLNRERDRKRRVKLFLEELGLDRGELQSKTLEEAFERYYESGKNSGTLRVMGEALEKLVLGKLLSTENTRLVLDLMERIKTGQSRIKAGLPPGTRFAQKTGTQIRRSCNMGVIRRGKDDGDSVVVAACIEKFNYQSDADRAFSELGRAIARAMEVK